MGIISPWIAAYIAGGVAIALIVYCKVKKTWKRKVQAKDFRELMYKGESFRSSISLSIAVLAILIPVASGLVAYQVRTNPDTVLDPLIAGLVLMLSAMIWGTYQVYSIATQCVDNDTFKITKDSNWLIPADFATHLAIWVTGIVFLLVFLVFYFDPIPTNESTSVTYEGQHIVFLHSWPLRASLGDLTIVWDKPTGVKHTPTDQNIFVVEPELKTVP